MATRPVVVGLKTYPAASIGMWGLRWDCAAILNVISRAMVHILALCYVFLRQTEDTHFFFSGRKVDQLSVQNPDRQSLPHSLQTTTLTPFPLLPTRHNRLIGVLHIFDIDHILVRIVGGMVPVDDIVPVKRLRDR